MGSYLNFKTPGEIPHIEGSGEKTGGNFPLARQTSVYSLTFDELQNTLGGPGKDFGSMNMDELLKNIWNVEETQAMATSTTAPSGNLQRQGSLTLPRTLSQKTVDEVWRDLIKECSGAKDRNVTMGSSNLHPQRQPTLGEVTLEEFLVRAGVVREDAQPITIRPNNCGFFGELPQPNNANSALNLSFQQSAQNNSVLANSGITENNKNNNLTNSSEARSSPPIFPKQATVAFASPIPTANNALINNPGAMGSVVRVVSPINGALVHGSVIQNGGASVTGLSPLSQISADAVIKSGVDRSSISPPTFMVSGGAQEKKHGRTLEKAVERRHRRMIKNRESAARSRARKQAYTLELEAEVEKLKKINQELRKKQDEIMEMQKSEITEKMNASWGSKRRCLRRTLTGPW
ncbi:hypothetical protein NMG60_11015288 [Bertholletia excelsa]